MRIIKFTAIGLAALLLLAGILLYQDDLDAAYVDAKYSNEHSQFLSLPNGARIHYRDQGRRDGLPIVLIHGANASLHAWEPWRALLAADYRIVSIDLPGHGLTGQVPGGDYSSKAYIETVDAVANRLELDRFVLGGNSMGGGVSWRYTLAHPERVKALILVDATGPATWWEDNRIADAASEGDTPLAFRLLQQQWFRTIARYLDPYYLVAQGLRAAYNHSPVVDDVLIDRYYELILRQGTREAILDRSGSWRRAANPPEDLASIEQPTLIMWGAKDFVISVDVADRFHETLPNSTLVVYDDLGHLPMEEDARRSAGDVRQFLASRQGLDQRATSEPLL